MIYEFLAELLGKKLSKIIPKINFSKLQDMYIKWTYKSMLKREKKLKQKTKRQNS